MEDILFANAPITIVCPGIVLNELDLYVFLRISSFPDRMLVLTMMQSQKNQPSLGRLARNATDWMMREVTRKDLAQPIVKGQAQRETCRSTGNWKVREKGEVSILFFCRFDSVSFMVRDAWRVHA